MLKVRLFGPSSYRYTREVWESTKEAFNEANHAELVQLLKCPPGQTSKCIHNSVAAKLKHGPFNLEHYYLCI